MKIRLEVEKDQDDVRTIHLAAFKGSGEAKLVDLLKEKASPLISLIAEDGEGKIVGHIMFSPVTLSDHYINIMGLGPVAVLPDSQNKGFGAALINKGLEECKKVGAQGVVLLGHADYLPTLWL